jgi:hypothetical protein
MVLGIYPVMLAWAKRLRNWVLMKRERFSEQEHNEFGLEIRRLNLVIDILIDSSSSFIWSGTDTSSSVLSSVSDSSSSSTSVLMTDSDTSSRNTQIKPCY